MYEKSFILNKYFAMKQAFVIINTNIGIDNKLIWNICVKIRSFKRSCFGGGASKLNLAVLLVILCLQIFCL